MYKYIKDDSNFYDLALELSENKTEVVYADLETTGLDCRQDKILLFQIMANDEIFIFDFLHLNNEHLKYLVNLLQTTKVTSVFHNTKFDIKFIAYNTGIWMNNLYDTMNAEVLINAGVGKSTYSLKELALKYCGIELNKDDRDVFYKEEVKVITEQMLNYSAMDVQVLKDIYRQQTELIRQAQEEAVLKVEMDLLSVVAKMEYDGVLLDNDKWLKLEAKEKERLAKASENIMDIFLDGFKIEKYPDAYEMAKAFSYPLSNLSKKKEKQMKLVTGYDMVREWTKQNINLGSNQQLKASLGLLGVKVDSVDKKVLKKLESSPIIDAMLEHSESSKRIETYGSVVLNYIHPLTGRIHTEFLNIGAATGRFSSGNPLNLQNIPNADGYRESFIAEKDFVWMSHDYSQQEFRLTGAVSKEEKIIDAYIQGADMHTATGSLIYEKPLLEINKQERFVGKTANFTIIYGGTEWALGRNLGISTDKSLEIINAFKNGYPKLAAFKEAAENMIVKLGYSSTKLGRRRYFSPKPIYCNNYEYMKWLGKLKREGFNHIIQGGAADITKIAMVNIYNNNPFGDKFRMLIQVHDELDSEAHKSISKDAAEFVKEEMLKAEQPFLGDIPAAVDVKIGEHWIH